MIWWTVTDGERFNGKALMLSGPGRKPRVDALVAAEFLDSLDLAEKADLIGRIERGQSLKVSDFAEARGFPRWVERFLFIDMTPPPAEPPVVGAPYASWREALRGVQVKNRGRFRKGPDPRRHLFTPEEQSRGGRTRWKQIMALWRDGLNLPLPREELKGILADCKRRGIHD